MNKVIYEDIAHGCGRSLTAAPVKNLNPSKFGRCLRLLGNSSVAFGFVVNLPHKILHMTVRVDFKQADFDQSRFCTVLLLRSTPRTVVLY